jgi:hypothetical protein
MDHVRLSSSPVLSRSTTVVEAVATSETVPVSSSVSVGATSVTAIVIDSVSDCVAPSETCTVRV